MGWLILMASAAVRHAGLGSPPAYLDPGSGSFLLQLLIAGLVGGLFLLRMSWGKVKAFLRRVFTGKRDKPIDES